MKRFYKYLFITIFFISSFLFINSVKAQKATVLNPAGASCSLKDNSTGYCYYSDGSLTKYVSGVIWLDTGDEVTILDTKEKIDSPNEQLCSDYYVYTSFYFAKKNKTYHGYYCNANLKTESLLTDELRTLFDNEGFPESYWEKLATLKTAHPNWEFKAINTELDFNTVVKNQSYGAKSLLRGSMSNNYAYLSISAGDSFDYYNDHFIAYDSNDGSDPWYKANNDTIAYYLDPRNFLSDTDIFQFETLSYNDSIDDDRMTSSINTIFGDDYLKNFTNHFVTAGKRSKVNPIYLASLSKEEIANGKTPGSAINGKYNGMYNFYNIGASSGDSPVINGLDFASGTDESTLRPWDNEEKAIVGGAIWIYDNYVSSGQDTSYFKKYNVVYNYLKSIGREPTYNNYAHQYMQNISAPSRESATTYRSYYRNNLLDLSFTFYIPVYDNMPEVTTRPESGGWPNNYLKSLTINGTKVTDFDGAVTTYNYNLDINNPVIEISAAAVNSTAKITGTGTFDITKNTTKSIKVTAENGKTKTYKIKITLTGTKLEDPVDVQTTLNNAGIKNGDKYLSGFNVEDDISKIKEKILNTNSGASVILQNSSGKEKNNGIICTGDKVIITIGSETKTYEVVIYGDATGDGKIKASDYRKIKDYIMGTTSLSGAYKEAADVDKNGNVKASDYRRIKDRIMGTNPDSIVQ